MTGTMQTWRFYRRRADTGRAQDPEKLIRAYPMIHPLVTCAIHAAPDRNRLVKQRKRCCYQTLGTLLNDVQTTRAHSYRETRNTAASSPSPTTAPAAIGIWVLTSFTIRAEALHAC